MSKSSGVRTASRPPSPAPSAQTALFDAPQAPAHRIDGALADLPHALRAAAVAVMKPSPLSRWQIAGQVSELLHRDVSKEMLDKYTSESAEGHRLPAELVPALCRVTQRPDLLQVLAEAAGYAVVPLPAPAAVSPSGSQILDVAVRKLAKELGELAREVEETLADGVMTERERAACRQELRDVIRVAVTMEAQLA